MIKSLEEALEKSKTLPILEAAVIYPDCDTISALKEASRIGLVKCHLFGPEEKMAEILSVLNLDKEDFYFHDCLTPEESALKGVEFCSTTGAMLIKGFLPTPVFLKAVLNKERGLASGKLLSHVAIFSIPNFGRLLLLTDGGIVVLPTLAQKLEILENSLQVAYALENPLPRVALLAAAETISPDIPATNDAAVIAGMWRRKQIKGCIVDGPLALDNAISPQALKEKGIESPVEGKADILLVPSIESGNLLGKALVFFGRAIMAGLVLGAKVPIVLVSRVDPPESKLYSVAIARLLSHFSPPS